MSYRAQVSIATLLATLATGVALAAGDVPRRADGRPDLSGNYDISTLTPLERDPRFGDRLSLSVAEAEEIAAREAALSANLASPSDPERQAPTEGGNVGGYNYFYMDRGTGAVMVDGEYRTSILTDPPNGRFPPMTERGRERRQGLYPFSKTNTGTAWWLDREVGPYDGPESLSIADRCIFSLEATIPILPKNYNNVKTIVQTDTHVMILIEWMHEARVVRLAGDGRPSGHLAADLRSRSGDSIGWWEGDTLVVETTNFLEEPWATTTLFGEPSPPADQRVVERFTRIDGDTLLYQFTVESADFEAPYSGEYTWPATGHRLYEYACHEGNYAMGNILRGARLLEAEAPAPTGGSR
ncbi:MAG: hypothetical protein R3190_01160 [Thermoanaerobaculia bacterium]|nr:hypothetical protein [Thermoanaerobaculia bacterium]